MKRKHARRFTITPLFSQKNDKYIPSGKLTKSPSKNPPCFFSSFHTIQVWHLSQKFCQCWPIRSCWSPFFTRRARALSKDTPRVEHDLGGPHNEALRNKDMEKIWCWNDYWCWIRLPPEICIHILKYMIYIWCIYLCIYIYKCYTSNKLSFPSPIGCYKHTRKSLWVKRYKQYQQTSSSALLNCLSCWCGFPTALKFARIFQPRITTLCWVKL